jgi:hypothetical protein
MLTIASAADTSGFAPVKTAFASLPPAKSMDELNKARSGEGSSGETAQAAQAVGTPGQPVPRPSA